MYRVDLINKPLSLYCLFHHIDAFYDNLITMDRLYSRGLSLELSGNNDDIIPCFDLFHLERIVYK